MLIVICVYNLTKKNPWKRKIYNYWLVNERNVRTKNYSAWKNRIVILFLSILLYMSHLKMRTNKYNTTHCNAHSALSLYLIWFYSFLLGKDHNCTWSHYVQLKERISYHVTLKIITASEMLEEQIKIISLNKLCLNTTLFWIILKYNLVLYFQYLGSSNMDQVKRTTSESLKWHIIAN